MGSGANPLTIHWSGCPAGCGNHQAADVGLRGFKTRIDGKIVDAVAIYTGGRTGPHAIAGQEILETVPCDESLPDVVASVIQSYRLDIEAREHAALRDPLFTAGATAGLASWRFVRALPPAAMPALERSLAERRVGARISRWVLFTAEAWQEIAPMREKRCGSLDATGTKSKDGGDGVE